MKGFLRLPILAAALVVLATPAMAQMDQGHLTGTVTDAQGGVLPGVTVTATSPALMGARTVVTGYSMAIGCVLYLPFAWPALRGVAWGDVSARAWWAVVLSAVFALCVAYMIWYTALQRIGNTRTAIYSNLVPVAGILVAWLWLGEPIRRATLAGAVAIFVGVALTKVQRSDRPVPEPA